jgi:hypothetical protein
MTNFFYILGKEVLYVLVVFMIVAAIMYFFSEVLGISPIVVLMVLFLFLALTNTISIKITRVKGEEKKDE